MKKERSVPLISEKKNDKTKVCASSFGEIKNEKRKVCAPSFVEKKRTKSERSVPVFNKISGISRRSVQLPMLSWSFSNQYNILSMATGRFYHISIVETMDNGERGMNSVASIVRSCNQV